MNTRKTLLRTQLLKITARQLQQAINSLTPSCDQTIPIYCQILTIEVAKTIPNKIHPSFDCSVLLNREKILSEKLCYFRIF